MPTPPSPGTAARSLAAVNTDIRALWQRGGRLSAEGRQEYERLLAEWAAVIRSGGVEAA